MKALGSLYSVRYFSRMIVAHEALETGQFMSLSICATSYKEAMASMIITDIFTFRSI